MMCVWVVVLLFMGGSVWRTGDGASNTHKTAGLGKICIPFLNI